ncbi:MAG: T9SS type A sorting domain-containing protein, partial [Bacteroidota bacterium]
PVVSGSASVCANSSSTYTTLANTGRTYVWTVTGGTITSGQGTASATITWGAAGTGSATVAETITASTCAATSSTFNVVKNAIPTPTVSGVSAICENSTSIYSTTFNPGRTYNWTVTGGSIVIGQGSSSVSVAWGSAGIGSIFVTDSIIASGCKGTSPALNVTKNSLPVPVVSGAMAVCVNATNIYSISTGTGRTSTWVVVGGTINSGQGTSTVSVTWGSSSAGFISVTDSVNATGCKSTSAINLININAIPTPVISGNASLCSGSTASYSTPSNTGRNYLWTVSGGTIVSGQGTASVSVIWTATSGNGSLTVRDSITASGCSATSVAYNVVINQLPQPVVTGQNTICGGATLTYSTPSNAGRSYRWTVTGGTIISGQNTASVNVLWNLTGSGSISVLDSNNVTGCFASTSPLSITIITKPVTSITGSNVVCGTSVSTYNVTSAVGHIYNWSVTNGLIIKGQNTDSIDVRWNGNGVGIVSLIDSVPTTGCASNTNVNVAINSLPNDSINVSGPLNICEGSSVVLVGKFAPNLTFNWSRNGLPITNSNGSSLFIDTAGVYAVQIVNNTTGCNITSQTYTTSILPKPIINLGPDVTVCQGTQVTFDAGAGFDLYLWSTGDTTRTLKTFTNGNIIAYVKGTNGCFNSDTVRIIHNIIPNSNFTFTQSGGKVTFTPEQSGLEYLWFFGDGDTSTTAIPTHTYSKNGIFISYLVTRSAAGCVDSTSKQVVINTVGVNGELAQNFEVNVYPNPFKDYLTINLKTINGGNALIKITDVSGRLMYETNLNTKSGNNEFELNNIPEMKDGMYFINIVQGNQSSIYKIVRTH